MIRISIKKSVKSFLIWIWIKILRNKNQNYLFLIAHPRSGSTLLMHILCSNPDIGGYGEYFITYDDQDKLIEAEFDIRRKSRSLIKKQHYIANQINAPRLIPRIDLLENNNRIIILIRNAKSALMSMKALNLSKKSNLSDKQLFEVYCESLRFMLRLTRELSPLKWICVEYESLVDNSHDTLKRVSSFLKLNTPLKTDYKRQNFTLKAGDRSDNIVRFKIVKTESKVLNFNVTLLNEAQEHYIKTLSYIKSQRHIG